MLLLKVYYKYSTEILERTVTSNENRIYIYDLNADGNYTEIHLNNEEVITVTYQIGKIITMLNPDQFFRVSRSAIINLKYLIEINRKKQCCILRHCDMKKSVTCSVKGLRLLEGVL